jgi:hypothetical protein
MADTLSVKKLIPEYYYNRTFAASYDLQTVPDHECR